LSYVIPRISAISLAVSPSIFFIVGNFPINLDKYHTVVKITRQLISEILEKIKIFLLFSEINIDLFLLVCDN
jgi:hypothetical protein